MLLVKIERVSLHNLAIVPNYGKSGVLRNYPGRFISSGAQIRKIDNAQDRAAFSVEFDFSVEN